MKANFKSMLVFAILFFTSFHGFTEVEGEYAVSLIRCPLCGNEYCVRTLESYYSTGSRSDRPMDTMISAPCPRCLYSWSGELPSKLDAQESQRVQDAIASLPGSLAPAERSRILSLLDSAGSPYTMDGDESVIDQYLIARCRAAREGKALPAFTAPKQRSGSNLPPDLVEERSAFLKSLPSLLQAQRDGKKTGIHPSAIFDALEETRNGNPQALEFALRWALTLNKTSLLDGQDRSSIRENFGLLMFGLAGMHPAPWPGNIDPASAHSPFVADCLVYIHTPNAPLPARLRHALSASQENGLRDTAIKACSAKRDRSVAPLLAKQLNSLSEKIGYCGISDYFKSIGIPSDIPAIARAARFCERKSAAGSFNDAIEAECFEEAIRRIQLKALLRGEKLVSYADGAANNG